MDQDGQSTVYSPNCTYAAVHHISGKENETIVNTVHNTYVYKHSHLIMEVEDCDHIFQHHPSGHIM